MPQPVPQLPKSPVKVYDDPPYFRAITSIYQTYQEWKDMKAFYEKQEGRTQWMRAYQDRATNGVSQAFRKTLPFVKGVDKLVDLGKVEKEILDGLEILRKKYNALPTNFVKVLLYQVEHPPGVKVKVLKKDDKYDRNEFWNDLKKDGLWWL